MRNTEELNADTLVERFDSINPKEPVQISLSATGATLPSRPVVHSRADDGVVGVDLNEARAQAQGNPTATFLWQMLYLMIGPIFISLMYSVYSLYSFIERLVKARYSIMKIEIKIPGDDQLKVKVHSGYGGTKDWVTLVPLDRHQASGYSYFDLRQMGEGKHTINRR